MERTNNGAADSYGAYTFVFHLTDLAGNEVWLEVLTKHSTLTDIFKTTVAETNVKNGTGDEYETMTITPSMNVLQNAQRMHKCT
jgi:hypothetical protein